MVSEAVNAMERHVRDHRGVSLVELEEVAAKYINVEGNLAWVTNDDPHIVIWAGISAEFLDVIDELRKRVDTYPTQPLVYMIDGKMLRLPVVERPPKGGYKKDHWLPVAFRVK